MCGRFRLDVEAAWSMTPGEFEDYLSGAIDGHRNTAYMQALVASFIAKTMGGTSVSPEQLLGEEVGGNDDLTPAERRAMFAADARRLRLAREARERAGYLPDGIALDDDE